MIAKSKLHAATRKPAAVSHWSVHRQRWEAYASLVIDNLWRELEEHA